MRSWQVSSGEVTCFFSEFQYIGSDSVEFVSSAEYLTHPTPEVSQVNSECSLSDCLQFYQALTRYVSDREGQHSSLVLSHLGLFLLSLLRLSSVGLNPLDGMSAGLSLPGQWLQSGAGTVKFLQPYSEWVASSPCQPLWSKTRQLVSPLNTLGLAIYILAQDFHSGLWLIGLRGVLIATPGGVWFELSEVTL